MSCILCNIVGPIENIAENYAMVLFQTIGAHMIRISQACLVLWFIWQVIFKGIVRGELDYNGFFKSLLLYFFIIIVISQYDMFWYWFYDPFNKFIQGILLEVLKVGIKNKPPNYNGMLEAVSEILSKISDIGKIFFSGSMFDIGKKIAGLPIIIVYIILAAMFVSYVLGYIFTLLVITAISPILFVCLNFKITRGFAIGGIKIVIQSALTLIISVIAISLTLVVINNIFPSLPLSKQAITKEAESWVLGANYFSCMIWAIVSIFFQLRAPVIAANITNIYDEQGPARIVAGAFLKTRKSDIETK